MPRRKPVNPQPSKKDGEEESPAEEGPSSKKTRVDKDEEKGDTGAVESPRTGTLTRSAAARAPVSSTPKPQTSPEPKITGKRGKGGKVKASPSKSPIAKVTEVKPAEPEVEVELTVTEEPAPNVIVTSEIAPEVTSVELVEQEETGEGATGEDGKKNLSMEALLQAANSELASIQETKVVETVISTTDAVDTNAAVVTETVVPKLDQEVIYVTLPSSGSEETPVSEPVTLLGMDEARKDKPVTTTLVRLDTGDGSTVQLPSVPGQHTYRLVYAKNPDPSPHKPIILKSSKQDTAPTQNYVIQKQPMVISPAQPSVGRKRKHPAKPGKHICSYCGRGCAKPSVLQKHIRAHTGERPYPCIPCGFSFKTKSNLYKHCKSRSHQIKAGIAKGADGSSDGSLPAQTSTDREEEDLGEEDEDEDMDSAEESAMEDGESIKSEENKDGASTSRVESEGTPKQRFKKKMKEEQKEKESVAKQNIVLMQQASTEKQTEDFTAAQNLLMTETPGRSVVQTPRMLSAPVKVSGTDKPVFLDVVFVSQDGTLVPAIRGKSVTSPHPGKLQIPAPAPADATTSVRVAANSNLVRDAKPQQIQFLSPDGMVTSTPMPETPSFSVAVPVTSPPSLTDPSVSRPGNKMAEKQMKVTIQLPKPSTPGKAAVSTPVPKIPPVDTKNLTPEALRDRISMLISVNSQIVDTPMADAPRPKRVSRQNSEPVSKPFGSMKQLLSSQLSTTIAPPTAGIQTALLPASSSPLPTHSNIFLSPHPATPDLQKGVEMTLVDVTPKAASAEVIQDVAPREQQHFLGLAEPSDQPPGEPTPAPRSAASLSTSLRCESPPPGSAEDNMAASVISGDNPAEIKIKFHLSQSESEEGREGDANPEGSLIKNLLLKQRIMPPIGKEQKLYTTSQSLDAGMFLTTGAQETVVTEAPPVVCEGCNVAFEEKDQLDVHRQHLCPMSQTQVVHSNHGNVVGDNPESLVILMNEDGTHEPTIISDVAKEVELSSSVSSEERKKVEPQTNVVLEVVDPKQPPKRGRPRGSRNRPKESSPTPSILPALNVTKAQQLGSLGSSLGSATPLTPDTPNSQSLWKLKLKGKLLMKRSMSVERMLSQDKEKYDQLSKEANSPGLSPMPETLGLNPKKQHPALLQRSRSVDAAGLKRKPKLIREYSLHEENMYDTASHGNLSVVPGPPGVTTNHVLNPPHEIVVIDEHNNRTEVILVQEREEGEGEPAGYNPPINQAVQGTYNTKPLFAPNINLKDQSVRLPNVINIPASLAQKIPGLVQTQDSDKSLVKADSVGEDGKEPTHHEVNLTGISKLLKEKVLVALLLLGHNYPSMGNTACGTFCSLMKTQPMYVPQGNNRKISMYSNWRTAGFNSNPMGLSTKQMLSLYRTSKSNSDPTSLQKMSDISEPKSGVLTHSSYWNFRKLSEGNADDSGSVETSQNEVQFMPLPDIVHVANDITVKTSSEKDPDHQPTAKERLKEKLGTDRPARVQIFPGGFKSNEDYTYVRGRGRGKYVCEECGIRCKKPSMLKKHIRTHTDLRPYNCQYCKFSFKTKGNLTKHMKSKAHHKLCTELGLDPIPTTVDDTFINSDVLMKQSLVIKGRQMSGMSMEEDDEDDGEDEGPDEEYDEEEMEIDGEHTIVVDVETTPDTVGKTPDTSGTPKYVALQQPDSAQPTFVRLDEDGQPIVYTPDAKELKAQELGRQRTISDDGSPRASIDKEIAASLLDLSKGREKEAAAAKAAEAAKGDPAKEDARLDQLIVALVSRTGDKPSDSQAKTAKSGDNTSAVQSAEDSHATIKALLTTPTADSSIRTGSTATATTVSSTPAAMAKSGFVPPIFIMSGAGLVQIQSPAVGQLTAPAFTRQESLSTLIPSLKNIPQPPSSKRPRPGEKIPEVAAGREETPGTDAAVTKVVSAAQTVSMPLTILGLEGSPTVTPGVQTVTVAPAGEGTEAAITAVTSTVSSTGTVPTSAAVKFVTGENRAPFEIVPIPLRVQADSETVDGKYVCEVCQKSFSKQHQLIMHRNIHYFERPFKCEDCNLSFKSKALLDKHVRSESHVAKVSLQQQFGPVSSVNPRPFKCDDCNAAFRIHGHLAKHLRSKLHFMKLEGLDKIPPGAFAILEKSQFKGVSFVDSESSLESILRALQNAGKEGQTFGEDVPDSENSLPEAPVVDRTDTPQEVVVGVHTSPIRDNFQYQRFGEFEKDDTRSNEKVTVEFQNKPIDLGDIVSKNSQQRQEEEIESQEGAHKCGICGKTFKEILRLKEHLVTHAELRPYVCEYCDAGFTNAQSLKFHLRTHTQEEPYICGMCGDTFARSDHHRRHMLTHERGHMSSRSGVPATTTSATPATTVKTGRSTLLQGVAGNQLLVAQPSTQHQTVRILPPLTGAQSVPVQTVQLPTGQPLQVTNLASLPGLGISVSSEVKPQTPGGGEVVPQAVVSQGVVPQAGGEEMQVIEVNPQQLQLQNITETDENGEVKHTQVLVLQCDGNKDMELASLGGLPNVFLSEEEANRLVKAGEIVITETEPKPEPSVPPTSAEVTTTTTTTVRGSEERSRRKFRRSEAIDASSYEDAMGSIVLGGDVFEQPEVSSIAETTGGATVVIPSQGRKRPHADSMEEDYTAKYRVIDSQGGQCALEPMFAPDAEDAS